MQTPLISIEKSAYAVEVAELAIAQQAVAKSASNKESLNALIIVAIVVVVGFGIKLLLQM